MSVSCHSSRNAHRSDSAALTAILPTPQPRLGLDDTNGRFRALARRCRIEHLSCRAQLAIIDYLLRCSFSPLRSNRDLERAKSTQHPQPVQRLTSTEFQASIASRGS
jgi:hypothetical protein